MARWTPGKLWSMALTKYWEASGYISYVKLLPVVIAAAISLILFASKASGYTVLAGVFAILLAFLIALPFVMAGVATDQLKKLSEEGSDWRQRAEKLDKENLEMISQVAKYQAEHVYYVEAERLKIRGDDVGRVGSFDLPIDTEIGWFEVEHSRLKIGQVVNWRSYEVEITKIEKRIGESDYGVHGKIARLPLLRPTVDDIIERD